MASTQTVFEASLLEQVLEPDSLKDKSHLKVRPLQSDDYSRGYLSVLSQLTTVGDVSEEVFQQQFTRMQRCGDYYVTVIEDSNTGRVIATATLFTEYKLVHQGGLRGRIEDVVVDNQYRGQKLGNLLIETLRSLAKHLGCYKLTLDCADEMIPWYGRFGFKVEPGRSNFLTIRMEK